MPWSVTTHAIEQSGVLRHSQALLQKLVALNKWFVAIFLKQSWNVMERAAEAKICNKM